MYVSRRNFLKSASVATLSALAAGEPRLWAGETKPEQPKATADTLILLWMAGGMAAPETFDPKRYQPFEVGLPVEKVMSTFPAIDTAVDNIKICARAGEHRQRDGPGHADPLARAARPGAHSALAASVSLAHRLRAAADGGRAAHRRVDGPRAGADQPGDSAVHQHRPAARRQRRNGRAQGVHTGGFFGTEFGPFICRFPITRSMPCGRRRE